MAVTASMTVAVLVLLGAFGASRCGSVANAIAYLRGARLLVDRQAKALGEVAPGDGLSVEYVLTNLTGEPIGVITAQESCSCAVVDGLPATIADSETRAIRLSISAPRRPGAFSGTAKLFTDNPRYGEFVLRYEGRVVRPR